MTPRTNALIARAGFVFVQPAEAVVLRQECAQIEQELQRELAAAKAEVEALRLALNVASGALLQCEPCMATECNQVQREWLDDARKLIDAALAKE
jgi:hypothetical protein